MSSTNPFLMLEKKILSLPDEELICFIRLYASTHQSDTPYMHTYKGRQVVLGRGEVAKSLSKLEELWHLTRDQVRWRLNKWEESDFIRKKVVGKGKNSITVISMYNIKAEHHKLSHEKSVDNKDVISGVDHNNPQHNKELINKELNKDTNILNPEIYQFGLIPFDEIKG